FKGFGSYIVHKAADGLCTGDDSTAHRFRAVGNITTNITDKTRGRIPRIAIPAALDLGLNRRRRSSLLDRMGQLMRQQMLPRLTARIKFAGIEIDIVPMRKCLCMQLLVHLNSAAADMYAHTGEVGAKRRLHFLPVI